jgi:UPF0755 protein
MALKFLSFISIIVVIAGFTGGGVYLWGYSQYNDPGPLVDERIVILPPGENVRGIAEILRDKGVVSNDLIFEIGARIDKKSRQLKAGEYAFPPQVSMKQAIDILVEGKVVVHRFTIPEGLVVREVLAILNENKILQGKITQVPVEGSLLPETYHFIRGDQRQLILDRMSAGMNEALATLWEGRDQTIPLTTPQEAVVLASIVEKATGLASMRTHIAGVFMNRLQKNMQLQSDPTVSYGITLGKHPLVRKLNRKDLAAPTPYNTYTIAALPPTPIANPGRATLAAVLKPKATNDLFFVADGKGGHRFAETYRQHQKNVRLWRKISK